MCKREHVAHQVAPASARYSFVGPILTAYYPSVQQFADPPEGQSSLRLLGFALVFHDYFLRTPVSHDASHRELFHNILSKGPLLSFSLWVVLRDVSLSGKNFSRAPLGIVRYFTINHKNHPRHLYLL